MTEFIREDVLAKRLGMNRDDLMAMRPKNSRTKGGAIEWPLEEAHQTAQILNLELPDELDQKMPGEIVTVCSAPARDGWHFGNHLLIKARRQNGDVVTVRVVDSKKYAPTLRGGQPMVLRARASEAGNWWLLVGREPRWKGMW